MSLKELPTEILLRICEALSPQDLRAARAACKATWTAATTISWRRVMVGGDWDASNRRLMKRSRSQRATDCGGATGVVLQSAEGIAAWLSTAKPSIPLSLFYVREMHIDMESIATNEALSSVVCALLNPAATRHLGLVVLYDHTIEWLLHDKNRSRLLRRLVVLAVDRRVEVAFVGHERSSTFRALESEYKEIWQTLTRLELTIWKESPFALTKLFLRMRDIKCLRAFELYVDAFADTLYFDSRKEFKEEEVDEEQLEVTLRSWLAAQKALVRLRCDLTPLSQIISALPLPSQLKDVSLEFASDEIRGTRQLWFCPDFLRYQGDPAASQRHGTVSKVRKIAIDTTGPKCAWDRAASNMTRLRLTWRVKYSPNMNRNIPHIHEVPFTNLTHLTVLGLIADGFDVAMFRANPGLREVIFQVISGPGLDALAGSCPNLEVLVILSYVPRPASDSVTSRHLRRVGEKCRLLQHLYINVGDDPERRIVDWVTVASLANNCPDLTEFYVQPGGGYTVSGYNSPYVWLGHDVDEHLTAAEEKEVSAHIANFILSVRPETLWYFDLVTREPMIRRWLLKLDLEYVKSAKLPTKVCHLWREYGDEL